MFYVLFCMTGCCICFLDVVVGGGGGGEKECKKINGHTSTPMNYFFLALDFSYEHSERFATFFSLPH